MTTPRHLRSHVIILLIATSTTLGVRHFLHDAYGMERKEIEHRGRDEKTRELLASWNALEFTESKSGNLTEECLRKIRWRGIELNEFQKERLKGRLREVFDYLQNPSPESFFRLKTAGLKYEFHPMLAVKSDVRRHGLVPYNDEGFVKAYWDVTTKSNSALRHITAICTDSIAVKVGQTNSPVAITHGKTGKGFTVGSSLSEIGFSYPLVDSKAEPLLFDVSFFARSNASRSAAPVYFSLQWSGWDQQWILNRLFSDSVLRLNTLF